MSQKGSITTAEYLPYEEFKYFLSKLREDKEYKWEIFSTISFVAALRCCDASNLKWEDILNKKQIMLVEQKTKKTRKIMFNDSVQGKINEIYLLSGNPDKRDYICPNRYGGAMGIGYINKTLREFKAIYNLSINNFSTHTFRKTFGRYVYETNNKSDESLALLSSILRHSNLGITMRYIGIREDEIQSVFASLTL